MSEEKDRLKKCEKCVFGLLLERNGQRMCRGPQTVWHKWEFGRILTAYLSTGHYSYKSTCDYVQNVNHPKDECGDFHEYEEK